MKQFIPPTLNPVMLGLTKMLMPLVLHVEKLQLKVSPNCVTTFRRMRDQLAVVLLNHADRDDPVVAFALSMELGEDFYYLAARELFDQNLGFRGWYMRNCGTYSVIRGLPEDEESRRKTVELIATAKNKLVEFPEGDVSGREDKILPLKRDGVRNIFDAQRFLVRSGNPRPVFLLPVSIFYEVQEDAIDPMEKCLSKLEDLLNLHPIALPLEDRINRALETAIIDLERYYGLQPTLEIPLEERLSAICVHAGKTIAQFAGLPINMDDEANVLYSARGALRRQLGRYELSDSEYGRKLGEQAERRMKMCELELDRLEQLFILASTLQQSDFTLETAWRRIDRLEQQLTGRPTAKGHRTAWIDSGPPINVLDFLPLYERSPREAIAAIDSIVRGTMENVLVELRRSNLIKVAV